MTVQDRNDAQNLQTEKTGNFTYNPVLVTIRKCHVSVMVSVTGYVHRVTATVKTMSKLMIE